MTSKIIERHIPCPSCESSDAFCRYDDGHGFCYSCEYYEGKGLLDTNYTYEYLPLRGVTRKTFEFFGCKTKIDQEGKPIEIAFPYPSGPLKIRSLDEKKFRWSPGGDTSKLGLFGRDKFPAGSHKYVTITEGELDAASLYQSLGSPVASVQSASTAARDCAVERSWLNSFEVIYLAFDADGPGRLAASEVARLFDYNRVKLVNFDQLKDANAYLEAGRENDLRNIWHNAKHFMPETVVTITAATAKDILFEAPKLSVPYPFPSWNDKTYGIRRGESVLITAQEGVGKTEVMRAIEYQLLRETNDAVGAIFLEEPKRRHLQGLAGLHLNCPVHLPDTHCTDTDALAAIQDLLGVGERLYVYSHFGSDDPEVLLDTIRFMVSARGVVYILLDHVSMVVSGLAGEDERRALDYLVTRLEMMVKELNFALIFVSHVNDGGLTRGSRYISKVADIRIDLCRDLLALDSISRNTTHVTISKNRFCGRTGSAGTLIFDPFQYKYTQAANDNFPIQLERVAA